jgi:hypothetical protein
MQWSHEPFDLEVETDNIYSHGRIFEAETAYEITINIVGSTESAFGRYLGCIMIGFMPDEGLEEAVFSLRDILEFYRHKPTPQLAKLPTKAIDATITDKKKRPNLVIA